MRNKYTFFLILIIIVGLSLRLFAVNWDSHFHFHPDERAIIVFTLPLQFPASLQQFFSQTSPWNPHFFAYGSFPLYLLKLTTSLLSYIDMQFTRYDYVTLIGRMLSALFDTGTIIVLYLIGKKLFQKNIGLVAAFFYAISVLPIQLSHFYAVDTIVTFFTTLLLYKLLIYYEHPRKKTAVSIGVILGFALATKISAIVLLVSVAAAISMDFLLIFIHKPHKIKHWLPHIPIFLKRLLIDGMLIIFSAVITFTILEPYAFIDFSEFFRQSLQQAEMTKNAFTFPYTLQYVGKISYLYEIQNSLLWGLGPILGIIAWTGCIFFFINLLKRKGQQPQHLIIGTFFIVYFGIIGSFAIGFMRYMLPLYPFLCLFASWLTYNTFLMLYKKSSLGAKGALGLFFILVSIWPVAFLSIYMHTSTRINASNWIIKNIPSGKTLAIEHWDDALPLAQQQRYHFETLELYNPDTFEKWQTIRGQLQKTDYIILASNRLYIPLQKLTDCDKLPPMYCYNQTANYYQKLFNGNLGFTKVAQFTANPSIPFINMPINDQSADESFTVYDHPKIIIFKKNSL